MDRNETVRISRLAAFGGLTSTDVSVLLIQYCVAEHNKPYEDTIRFVTALLGRPIELKFYVKAALEYYERKFTVCKLWSAFQSIKQYEARKKVITNLFNSKKI